MRRTIILMGAAFAAMAIAAAYALLGGPAPADLVAMARGSPRIAPGFIGMANFGNWRLICVPGPPTLDGLGAGASAAGTPPATKAGTANACRINQEMPAQEPGGAPNAVTDGASPRVIIAANFSLVGPKRMPAAMLRLPPTARTGDTITLRFDDSATINTIVRDCAAAECLAAGTLSNTDWAHLSTAKSLQVTFPAAGRQWVLLSLPIDGLSDAILALDRAELAAKN